MALVVVFYVMCSMCWSESESCVVLLLSNVHVLLVSITGNAIKAHCTYVDMYCSSISLEGVFNLTFILTRGGTVYKKYTYSSNHNKEQAMADRSALRVDADALRSLVEEKDPALAEDDMFYKMKRENDFGIKL